jgi:hypothetical protein
MKLILSKNQWQAIGRKLGWDTKSQNTGIVQTAKEQLAVFYDNGRKLKLYGPRAISVSPYIPYDAEILDEYNNVESSTTATLDEIYKWAKDHNFNTKGSFQKGTKTSPFYRREKNVTPKPELQQWL